MPPLLKMEKKSNMTAPVSSKVCKQLFNKYELCTKDNLYYCIKKDSVKRGICRKYSAQTTILQYSPLLLSEYQR